MQGCQNMFGLGHARYHQPSQKLENILASGHMDSTEPSFSRYFLLGLQLISYQPQKWFTGPQYTNPHKPGAQASSGQRISTHQLLGCAASYGVLMQGVGKSGVGLKVCRCKSQVFWGFHF